MSICTTTRLGDLDIEVTLGVVQVILAAILDLRKEKANNYTSTSSLLITLTHHCTPVLSYHSL